MCLTHATGFKKKTKAKTAYVDMQKKAWKETQK